MSAPARIRAGDGPVIRAVLIGLSLLLGGVFLGAPLVTVFAKAFAEGWSVYAAKISDPFTRHAVFLTLLTVAVVVPLNAGFGICAAWAITRHRFRGKRLLTTLIDLPVSISPIAAGVAYLFLYGAMGLLGPFLIAHGWRIMFSVPAIFLVSLFVTAPYVARELITAMQAQGVEDEEAALSLGATGLQMFAKVTLPNIGWALFYGVLLCNARVMGEFGAVSVVSGKIRGETNTLPLHIELLFNDYNATGAFAAATLLVIPALVTLALRGYAERRARRADG